MFRSLKVKFFLAFGTLIVVLVGAVGLFLVNSKAQELYADVANSTQAFAQNVSEDVIYSYEHSFLGGNFLGFNSDVAKMMNGNSAISSLSIANYSGEILYDYEDEQAERYSGDDRVISDQDTLDRVQANYPSIFLDDGRIVYLMVNDLHQISYVDVNEYAVSGRGALDKIVNIVVPYNNEYAVFYSVNYDAVTERLVRAEVQILLVVGIGLVLSLMVSFMLSVSITSPLKALKLGASKIASGDFSTRVQVRTKDEIGLLAGTFNKMAEDLAASTEAMVYQERVEKELELASQIQMDLLPKEEVSGDTFDLSGGLVPATEIGGDAFDYIEMNDGRYLVYLGDVTGHGVPAGIISSIADALLYGMRDKTDMHELLSVLNDVLMKKTTEKVFMTMALVLWDPKKDEAYYLNAGHPPVLFYDSAQKQVKGLELPGMALGMVDKVEDRIKMETLNLKGNDVIVLYSDGVPEAVNKNGEQYGMARLKRIVQDVAVDLYTAKGIKNAILSDVVQFIDGEEHRDDMTVVVLKRKASS